LVAFLPGERFINKPSEGMILLSATFLGVGEEELAIPPRKIP